MVRLPKSSSEYFSTRRIEALTDGVFAIAMTLLILDLKVDFGALTTNGQLWHELSNMQERFLVFVVSFLVLGSMWAVHMRQFEYIKHADRHLTMINNLRLLAAVVMPLTTSIAGNYHDLVLGRILLPLNFFILALISYWQWNYAVGDNQKFYDEKLTKTAKSVFARRNKLILGMALLVTVAVALLGSKAYILFFLTPFVSRYISAKNK
jgi:uncharacterized membrane protein